MIVKLARLKLIFFAEIRYTVYKLLSESLTLSLGHSVHFQESVYTGWSVGESQLVTYVDTLREVSGVYRD